MEKKKAKEKAKLPAKLEPIELFAWMGMDELGSGTVGIKQGRVPAGYIPLVSIDREKIAKYRDLLVSQSNTYGKKIYLCRFVCVEVVETTPSGESL